MQAETLDEFVKRQTARENATAGRTVDWKKDEQTGLGI